MDYREDNQARAPDFCGGSADLSLRKWIGGSRPFGN
jgi:hypothetical protein